MFPLGGGGNEENPGCGCPKKKPKADSCGKKKAKVAIYCGRPKASDDDSGEQKCGCEPPRKKKPTCGSGKNQSCGFKNYLKAFMKKNCGMSKCEAIKKATCKYKKLSECEKKKYRKACCDVVSSHSTGFQNYFHTTYQEQAKADYSEMDEEEKRAYRDMEKES